MQHAASIQIGDARCWTQHNIGYIRQGVFVLLLLRQLPPFRTTAEDIPGFLLSLFIREAEHVSQIGKLRSNQCLTKEERRSYRNG